jgi:hypothetical protein
MCDYCMPVEVSWYFEGLQYELIGYSHLIRNIKQNSRSNTSHITHTYENSSPPAQHPHHQQRIYLPLRPSLYQ